MIRTGITLQMTAAVLAVPLLSAAPLHADLVNGYFSDPILFDQPLTTGNWVAYVDGATDAGIYQVQVADGSFIQFSMDKPSPEGTELRLEQLVATAPGSYRLSFDFTFDSGPSESDYFSVRAMRGDSSHEIYREAVVATNHEQDTPYSVSGRGYLDFTSISDPVLLSFSLSRDSTSEVATMATLDNVELSVVPVPGAVVLGSLGLALSGWLCRRKMC